MNILNNFIFASQANGALVVFTTYTFLAFALISFILAALAYWNHRRMKSNPTTLIKDLQEGLVTIKGTVQARGSLLTSPLAKAQCVFYGLFLNRFWRSGTTSYVHTYIKDVTSTSFVVNDGTGVVAIKTDDLVFDTSKTIELKDEDVAVDGHSATGTPEDLSREVLQTLGEDVHHCNHANETCLKDGDELFIHGFAQRLPPKPGDHFLTSDDA